MNEVHGLANITKVSAVSGDLQQVRVVDRCNGVELVLAANTYPALMTPDEAKFIGKLLIESARRVEKSLQP